MNKELRTLLLDIDTYNQEFYNSHSRTEKIDFSQSKKSWGKEVIPKQFWINPSKIYVTECGFKVENLSIVIKNSSENEVTFPVKGTIIVPRKGKSDKRVNCIWTLDGRESVTNIFHEYNLVLS